MVKKMEIIELSKESLLDRKVRYSYTCDKFCDLRMIRKDDCYTSKYL